jgi:hypothetical protein
MKRKISRGDAEAWRRRGVEMAAFDVQRKKGSNCHLVFVFLQKEIDKKEMKWYYFLRRV